MPSLRSQGQGRGLYVDRTARTTRSLPCLPIDAHRSRRPIGPPTSSQLSPQPRSRLLEDMLNWQSVVLGKITKSSEVPGTKDEIKTLLPYRFILLHFHPPEDEGSTPARVSSKTLDDFNIWGKILGPYCNQTLPSTVGTSPCLLLRGRRND
nr:hypothetical protein CFP56_68689 [Quercus suber]